jgi:hypothetical protein
MYKLTPKYIHLVPKAMLDEYINLSKLMPVIREIHMERYFEIERQRAVVHDKILDLLGIDREDRAFAFELALYCEDIITGIKKEG